MSISDKIREAREWGRCVDTLKASVDSMYEICRIQQNILGCEEAIMFLKHAIRDFHCLIDTIKIEQNWENSEERPMISLAWEIRGTVSRNSVLHKDLKEKECQTQQNQQQKPTASGLIKGPASSSQPKPEINGVGGKGGDKDNEWQVVQRRKSFIPRQQQQNLPQPTVASSGRDKENQQQQTEGQMVPFGRSSMGVTKAPKSAMDLPQTKSSMAKMAYSRQLLFEKHKKVLIEKMNSKKRRKQQQSGAGGGGESGRPIVPIELPTTAKIDAMLIESGHSSASAGVDERKISRTEDCLKILLDQLSDDLEWRTMTEEEESLAQEEASLKKEIEEEENLSPFEDCEELEEDTCCVGNLVVGLNGQQEQQQSKGEGEGAEDKAQSAALAIGAGASYYRNPGELAQLRAKLMSPTKRRRTEDYDSGNKLRRADELRAAFHRARAERLQLLHQRVEEVRKKREEIQERKLAHLEKVKERIQRAEENRQKGLDEIVLRAEEDELKIKEINLLHSFEAENKKLKKRYIQMREKNRYQKQVQMAEEQRQRKIEENKHQKEAAEQRRKDAEEQRTQRLKDQADRRQLRQCHALGQRTKAMEKYKARMAQHNQRMSLRKAREQTDREQLLHKIQQKHEKSVGNYEHCKELVRRRALELASPRPAHQWAQWLADFSQCPSDLGLQYWAKSGTTEQSGRRIHSAGGNYCTATAAVITCNRCKVKLHTDLQLISHVISEDHLAGSSVSCKENVQQSTEINYDFLKSELSQLIGGGSGGCCSSADDSLLTSTSTELDFPTTTAMADSQTSSDGSLLSPQELQPMSNCNTFERLLARLVEVNELQQQQEGEEKGKETNEAEQMLGQLLGAKGGTANPGEAIKTGTGIISNTANAQIGRKKRSRIRQKFARDFDSLDSIQFTDNKIPSPTKSAPTPVEVRRALHELVPLLRDFNSKSSLVLGHEMQQIERALSELVKHIGSARGQKEWNNAFGHHICQQDTNFAVHLLSFCVRIEHHKMETKSSAEDGSSTKQFSRIVQKSFHLIGHLIEQNCHLSGKALQLLCDLFHLNAQMAFSFSTVETTAKETEGESMHNSMFALSLLAKLMARNPESGHCRTVLLSYLNSSSLLMDFVARCGRLEFAELAGPMALAGDLAGQETKGSSNICETICSFCCALFAPAESQQKQKSKETNNCLNLAEKVSLSWLLLLTLHLYQQFQLRPPLLGPVVPADHSAAQRTNSQSFSPLLVAVRSWLTLFNTICGTGNAQFARKLFSLEKEGTMATRVACILRSTLQQRDTVGGGGLLLTECIHAVGHFATLGPLNQLLCVLGWHRSLLCSLCSLPLEMVHCGPHKHSLLPALCAILLHCPLGVQLVKGEFCLHYLIQYIQHALNALNAPENKFLGQLIPPGQWLEAKSFFEANALPSAAQNSPDSQRLT